MQRTVYAAFQLCLLIFLTEGLLCQDIKESEYQKDNFIIINSEPAGAEVFLDSVYIGKTPLEIKDSPRKYFPLRMKKDGYKDWAYGFIFRDEPRKEIFACLEGSYGLLNIISDPANAQVFIDDTLAGSTPLIKFKLPARPHSVKIVKDGFQIWQTAINMSPSLESLDIQLIRTSSPVAFLNIPAAAKIKIDGEYCNHLITAKVNLPEGEHRIEVTDADALKNIDEEIETDPAFSYRIETRYDDFSLTQFKYSFFVPGSGQFLNKSYLKGASIFTAAMLSGYFYYESSKNYNKKVDAYNNALLKYNSARNETEAAIAHGLMKSAASDESSALKYKRIAIGLMAGVYIYNIIDALLFNSRYNHLEIYKSRMDIQTSDPLLGLSSGIKMNVNIPLK